MMEPVPARTASANGLVRLATHVGSLEANKPEVQLVESSVINVRADTLGNIVAITKGLTSLTEVLLLIANVVLCA
jgi:hypothetical protein